jgi:hypothetical protein
MVSRTVDLGRAEESYVVGLLPVPHELRHELLRRKAAKPPIFWWHNDVEASMRDSNMPMSL